MTTLALILFALMALAPLVREEAEAYATDSPLAPRTCEHCGACDWSYAWHPWVQPIPVRKCLRCGTITEVEEYST